MFKLPTVSGFMLGGWLGLASGCNNAGPALEQSTGQGDDRSVGAGIDNAPADLDSASTQHAAAMAAGTAGAIPQAAVTRPDVGPREDGSCVDMLSGRYGVKIELDVWWLDELNTTAPLFDPGRGVITLLAQTQLSEFCQNGTSGASVTRSCDLDLPALYSDENGGVVQLGFAGAAWDHPSMPSFASDARTSGFAPADIVSVDSIDALLGIALADDAASWPSYAETPHVACANGTGADCFPDQDGDGKPGITARVKLSGDSPDPGYPRRGGWRYVPAPTDPSPEFFGYGATQLYLGLRTTLSTSHPIGSDCQGGVGTADASDLQLRVLDCAMRDGTKCSAAAANFVDQNAPSFHVLQRGETPPARWRHRRADADAKLDRSASLGPRNTTIRLGDLDAHVGCAEVREAFASTGS
jgi:hypothetical protein